MKALITLANGFEQTEALTTMDIFCRSGMIEPTLASIDGNIEVTSSMGLVVKANKLLKEINPDEYDFLVLPGGKKGVDNLLASKEVEELIKGFKDNNKDVYAICAAPSILGKYGYLKGLNYTVYPGFEGEYGNLVNEGVIQDKNMITGRAMAFTIEFALKIVEARCGKEVADKVLFSARGHI